MSDETTTPEKEPSPWSVKGMPQEDRDAVTAAAKRGLTTNGEWLRSAIALKLHHERRPPARPVPAEAGPTEAYPLPGSVDVVVQLAAVLPGLTTEARGGGPLAALARKVMTQHLRALLIEPGSTRSHTPARLAPPD